jgi:hypothetical protein
VTAHRKKFIEIAALSGGIPINPRSIVRVSRSRRVLTYRHVWGDDTDGRVWFRLTSIVRAFAREIANADLKSVEVYAHRGYLMDVIEQRTA